MTLSRYFLDEVAAVHGPSFYIIDSERFCENFNKLTEAFRMYYPKTTIAYSYKTNYIPRYCKLVAEMGGYAEVVSSMEMQLAIKLGVPPSNIFFNGPYKEDEHVDFLLHSGGTVNVDSIEELQRIANAANYDSGKSLELGLRCNFDVRDGVISRFGFDVESEELLEAITLIDRHPQLKLTGLHCHFATRSLDCWQYRTMGMIDVLERNFRQRLTDLRRVSLGGGIYGHMPDELKAQFPTPIPSFEDYAKAAALPIARYFQTTAGSHQPELIIEPGTALVADAMKYVCKVNSIKKVQDRYFVTVTGSSYNINPNPNRKNLPIQCFPTSDNKNRIYMSGAFLCGYTCIESDYLYKDFHGDLAVGDFLVFEDVGSYSIVMKPPFILPNVAVVEPLTDKKTWITIKRPETFEDIFSTYFHY